MGYSSKAALNTTRPELMLLLIIALTFLVDFPWNMLAVIVSIFGSV